MGLGYPRKGVRMAANQFIPKADWVQRDEDGRVVLASTLREQGGGGQFVAREGRPMPLAKAQALGIVPKRKKAPANKGASPEADKGAGPEV